MGGSGRTPYATEIHNTSQKSPRDPNVTPWLIVVHHAATEGFDAVVTMENGTKQVSSTVVIKDGRCASMFDEAYRAWSLSSGYYDSVSLSSETCNSGGAAEGWPISEASYQTLAKVIAEWCRKYGIPANRERIIGHREVYTRYGASYATACPGGIDLDRLVQMVNNLLISGAGSGTTPIGDDMPLTDDDINKITQGLRNAVWLVGPNGEPLRYEVAVKDIANRLVGYGARTEDMQVNQMPAVLTRLAALDNDTLSDTEINMLAKAITPSLVAALGKDVATGTQLAATRDSILAALAKLPAQNLAEFGLKRA